MSVIVEEGNSKEMRDTSWSSHRKVPKKMLPFAHNVFYLKTSQEI